MDPDFLTSKQYDPMNGVRGWPALIDQLIGALIQILEGETKLIQASVSATATDIADRLMGRMVALIALSYGILCFVGTGILFLHKWFDWWIACGIMGGGLIVMAVCVQLVVASKHSKDRD